jgi:hypothetical protein
MWAGSGGGGGTCAVLHVGRWKVCMWSGRPECRVNTSDDFDEENNPDKDNRDNR